MNLQCFSISHKTTSFKTLESFHIKNPENILAKIKNQNLEGIVLQTCLRTELYWLEKEATSVVDSRKRCSSIIGNDISHIHHQHFQNSDAVNHLFRVSCGLESAILGEYEILGQLKKAIEMGRQKKTVGNSLMTILRFAVNTGIKVREETRISNGNVSIGSVAVEIILEILGKSLDVVVVIGAGEVAGLIGKALSKLEITDLVWMNRTYERSLEMTTRFPARPLEYTQENLVELLSVADIIILATGCPRRLIKSEHFDKIQRKKPLLLVDLGNPRNVTPELAHFPMIHLVNLQEIKKWTQRDSKRRVDEIPAVERLIDQALVDLAVYQRTQRYEPTISEIYKTAERIRTEQLEKTLRSFELDKTRIKMLDKLTKALVKQILDVPIRNIRQSASILPQDEMKSLLSLFHSPQYESQTSLHQSDEPESTVNGSLTSFISSNNSKQLVETNSVQESLVIKKEDQF